MRKLKMKKTVKKKEDGRRRVLETAERSSARAERTSKYLRLTSELILSKFSGARKKYSEKLSSLEATYAAHGEIITPLASALKLQGTRRRKFRELMAQEIRCSFLQSAIRAKQEVPARIIQDLINRSLPQTTHALKLERVGTEMISAVREMVLQEKKTMDKFKPEDLVDPSRVAFVSFLTIQAKHVDALLLEEILEQNMHVYENVMSVYAASTSAPYLQVLARKHRHTRWW
ncbi:hypothetical protein KKG83_05435 [Candidatus Micrarchaeota archaeon]|nr:hypothetical protein [Candidatus Micrarchaeota archaeon]MBU2476886.1 hypothetical protein [Candidatus Micrarchaeota archaeon]